MKSAPPKPEPTTSISLEAHQQELADACEEARRTTAERCAEIADRRGHCWAAREIRGEFGLKESK